MIIVRTSTVGISLNVLLKGQLHFLSRHFDVVGVSSNDSELQAVREREGIEVHGIDMKRNISPISDLVGLIKLYRFLRNKRPHLIHSITPKAGLLSMVAGKAAGVPIRMHTFTGLIFPSRSGFLQKLLIWADRVLCLSATHIYPEGEGVKRDLIDYRITKKSLRVLANGNINGIDLDYFSFSRITELQNLSLRRDLGLSSEDFVFIFVGRIVRDKGINELIAAFRELCKSPEANHFNIRTPKLLLVGAFEDSLDPLTPETLSLIRNNSNIISVGYQADVRPYFAISDALIFPSYREGFPNVVMQAGAMGLPSIVSDINGCNEIIIDGQNGAIIPPKNIEALQAAMLKLMNDKVYYNQLKANARPMIASRYDQKVVWEALLEEYKSALKEKGIALA